MRLAIFTLTKKGRGLGKKLSKEIEADLFAGPEVFKTSVKSVFKRYDGLIFIMAAGIVVRTIAPLLKSKSDDPAVVVMDENGRYAVSLLSGHIGGANKLARDAARIVCAQPVVTTATDVQGLPCIEDIADRFNLVIEDIKKIKPVNSAIVNRGSVAFVDKDAKRLKAIRREIIGGRQTVDFAFSKSLPKSKRSKKDVVVIVTNNYLLRPQPPAPSLMLRPRELVVGVGCDRGVSAEEVEDAYSWVLKKWNISPLSVRNLATIDVKKDEKGLLTFAGRRDLKMEFYSKDELSDMPLPSGPSGFVMKKIGVGGVCEPAALKSAGARTIWIKKEKRGRVTIAVAKAPFTS